MRSMATRRRKRDRSKEVVCRCPAYRFPHRCGGGRCTGDEWAEAYRIYNGELCERCNCYQGRGSMCDVSGGLEGIEHCEGYQEAIRTNETLPLEFFTGEL